MVTLKARVGLGEGFLCKIETGHALVKATWREATGGSGLAVCSGDLLLEALTACAGVTLSAMATALGIEIQNGVVHAEGDLDFRGTLGVSKETPVFSASGYISTWSARRAKSNSGTPAPAYPDNYAVVYQTLRQPPEMSITSNVTASTT